jgi:hypothetical protein
MRSLFKSLIFLIISIHLAYAADDGRWQLVIDGVDRLEFGTQNLAGGISIGWQSILEFSIEGGQFEQGTGTARLLPEISAYSRPQGMFQCSQVSGTFASRSGMSFSTPHLRYQAFPLSGQIRGERVELVPFLEYPGNYYAVLYQCSTRSEFGDFWFERSPRISRELSKRQDSDLKLKEGEYRARIKEVKGILPGPSVEIPLIDGFALSVEHDYGARRLSYSLRRIEP